MVNIKVVAFILGILLVLEGAFMFLAAPISWLYGDPDALYIFVASFLTALAGFILWASFRNCNKNVGDCLFCVSSYCWLDNRRLYKNHQKIRKSNQ